jgi:hypothetical protein
MHNVLCSIPIPHKSKQKLPSPLGIERNLRNRIPKSPADIVLNGEALKVLPLIGSHHECPASLLNTTGRASQCDKARKPNKGMQCGKEERTLSLFSHDIIY